MPKNKGKGGKNRKRGKNENEEDVKRELVNKDQGQAYAQVLRMLGGGYLEAMCFEDGKKKLCHIRGKLRKKVWINSADIILIGLRDFQDDKADVILKYTTDEARQLKYRREIPEGTNITETQQFGQDNGGDNIVFDEIDNDSDDSDDEDDGKPSGNLNRKGNLNRGVDIGDDIDNSGSDIGEDNEIDRI
jgi:translation initiation factor 1A